MNVQPGRWQWFVGSSLLAAALIFGFYGIAINAVENKPVRYVPDETYVDECGSCHLAYPPGLLPRKSWNGIMQDLANHFEDNAEMDEETASYITAYLLQNALREASPNRMSQMLRNMPEEPPLRITEFPFFIQAHEEIPKQLQKESLKEGYLSPCEECHRQAGRGLFDKELLFPGYGPSVWGGSKPS